ncbi:hypothetical protein V1478_004539 [Vespula squamosa]|uniref:Uncharacterized protein n=1 Tax=Vespula squamosa TaxID=30214 RepID=A0ABD2BGH1_VESSQ
MNSLYPFWGSLQKAPNTHPHFKSNTKRIVSWKIEKIYFPTIYILSIITIPWQTLAIRMANSRVDLLGEAI